MSDEILTKKEAAKYLRMSVSTLDRLMRNRSIPYSKINGKVLFQKKDLIKWLESKKVR
jgi:excisionase family DNA binding protein